MIFYNILKFVNELVICESIKMNMLIINGKLCGFHKWSII